MGCGSKFLFFMFICEIINLWSVYHWNNRNQIAFNFIDDIKFS